MTERMAGQGSTGNVIAALWKPKQEPAPRRPVKHRPSPGAAKDGLWQWSQRTREARD
jgi:hypothetical protein